MEALQGLELSSIALGRTHSAVVTTGGDLFVWGSTSTGQLGIDTQGYGREWVLDPATARSRGGRGDGVGSRKTRRRDVGSSASAHSRRSKRGPRVVMTLANKDIGDLYCVLPTRVRIPSPSQGVQRIESVSCGHAHTAAVDVEGRVWVWGSSDGGRLGIGVEPKQLMIKCVVGCALWWLHTVQLSRVCACVVCAAGVRRW